MKYELFIKLFFTENLFENLLIYGIILFLFFQVFKKELYSLFDPFVKSLILPVACSCTIIIWLEIHGYINGIVFFELLFSFLCFLFGFFKGKHISTGKGYIFKTESYNFFKLFYFLHYLFFIIVLLLYIKTIGLSAWNDKIAARQGNGLIIYLSNYFPLALLILVQIKKYKYNKVSLWDYFFYFCLIVFYALSGSKGAFINLICLVIVLPLVIKNCYLKQKKNVKLISGKIILLILFSIISILLGIVVINKQVKMSPKMLLSSFSLHFFEFGDIYYLALPNDLYKDFIPRSLIKYIFFPLIGPLYRIVPFTADRPVGFEIIEILYNKTNSTTGPNSRLFFMLLISGFKVLPYIISMFVGFLIARIRKCQFFGNTIFGMVFSIILFFNIQSILTDVGLFGLCFFALFFFLPFTYLLTFLLMYSMNYKVYTKEVLYNG